MDFSVMFWGDLRLSKTKAQDQYSSVLEIAKYADQNGYAGLWIPERHFHPWGGLFPNPSVWAAALATVTKRIRLRAGSVVVPLHHPVRIAEEWSLVDNLSAGRVEVSVASGWRADDFILAPGLYEDRGQKMFDLLEIVQRLWRGEKYVAVNPHGQKIEAEIYPRPVQPELPVWVTSAGSIRTMASAGSGGFGLLTHLLGQEFSDLEKKVAQYRAYRVRAGLQGNGKVALMLHTFIGKDASRVKETVKGPMVAYLGESADLAIPAKMRPAWEKAPESVKRELIELAFERYYEESGLMGTPDRCRKIIEKVAKIGVTDICCLVDFGLGSDLILESLKLLTVLKNSIG